MGEMYFDYASTTPVKQEVLDSMLPYLSSEYGNPSSHYRMGFHAHKVMEDSRAIIAATIGAEPDEIFFTSCGSEANTWAMTCLNKNYHCLKTGVPLISPIEHHSVLNSVQYPNFIDVDKYGVIDVDSLKDKIKDSTYMVSTMMVNNEVGTIEPIKEIAPICKERGIFYHVDGVQALGHIPINVKELEGVTTLSLSGHKIGAPKGIGALYIRRDVQSYYRPLICGGQQERGLRGGTENVAFIVGFAKACTLAKEDSLKLRGMTIYCWDFLKDNIPNTHMNGLPLLDKAHIPNILNVSIDGIEGEELTELLNEQGFCISTGSACNSDSAEPSHVLKAMGLSDDRANSSIRISLSGDTKLIEVNSLCQRIVEDVEMLRAE